MKLDLALKQLEAVFGKQEPSKLAVYAITLRHLSEDEIERALKAALRVCEFFPAPSKIMELARGHTPALAALPPRHENPHEHSGSREVAGRFRERGTALDGKTYCAADLQGYPSRAMIAAREGDVKYLTLHGEADIEIAARDWGKRAGALKVDPFADWGTL